MHSYTKNSAQTFGIINIVKPEQAIPAHSRILLIVGGSIKVADEAFTLSPRPTQPREQQFPPPPPKLTNIIFPTRCREKCKWIPTTVCYISLATCYIAHPFCYTHQKECLPHVHRGRIITMARYMRGKKGHGNNGRPFFISQKGTF